MADIKGVLTTLNHALPSGLDANRLAQWLLKDGSSYLEFRQMMAAAMDDLNSELMMAWGDLVFVTNEDHFEYPDGGSIEPAKKLSELDRPDARKGTTVGHMLDLERYGDAVGGSKIYFRDTRQAVIQATIANQVQRLRDRFEVDVLTRAMTDNENLLGSSGYDVGFASASASVTYTPPKYAGQTFASTHTHYIGYNASTPQTVSDMLDGLANTVHEHGHRGPFVAYVATADVATYRSQSNFEKYTPTDVFFVDRAGATSGNEFFRRGEIMERPQTGGWTFGYYISPYGEIELRGTSRIPTGYALVYKSYGNNDERNPLAVRVHPDVGFGVRLVEEPSFDSQYPVKTIYIEKEYGVSAGPGRTGGASGYLVAGGAWVDPTIA